MLKKIVAVITLISLSLNLISCSNLNNNNSNTTTTSNDFSEYSKYESNFIAGFDTYATIVGYAKSEEEFTNYTTIIYNCLDRLGKYFDIYNYYDGINNLKTVNDNAGISAVTVDKELLNFMIAAKKAYYDTNGVVNIALGSVLSVWHDYRTSGINDPENAKLPPMDLLKENIKNTNIEDVIIDEEASTIFLKNKGMSLDVGAIAKGYAAQIAADEVKASGCNSALLNIGGNIVSIGKPFDGVRDRWGVGIQNPKEDINKNNNVYDTVFVNYACVVSSGNYQRYYIVDGKSYNHIINSKTLMPSDNYDAVTIIHDDSFIADMLSTAIYILPYEDGLELVEKFNGDAIWIYADGTQKYTDGYYNISNTLSGYTSIDKK